jgi:DNA-binding response OmpR family regulator
LGINKILLVDDDRNLLDVLKYNLEKENYSVITAADGIQALELARSEKPDLIILDIMLPGLSGFEVCRILRKDLTVPILMLTAKTEEVDKVVGLELGADDYMTKPFSVRELMARVRAMLRRAQGIQQQMNPEATPGKKDVSGVIKAGGFEVDLLKHTVSRNGARIDLSPREFELFTFLARHQGQVFARERLVEKVWGFDYKGTARTVDVHMRSLRCKIENDPAEPEYLLTVHGFGYKFEALQKS